MSTVNVIALKPFIYSKDGYTEIPASEKQVFDLPEHLFAGLNKAGYVRRAVIGDGHFSLKPVVTGESKNIPVQPQATGQLTYTVSDDNAPTSTFNEPIIEGLAALAAAENPSTESPSKTEETASVAAVEIPDDWRTFKFFALRSLATKLGASVKTMDEAVAAIEAEIARRG